MKSIWAVFGVLVAATALGQTVYINDVIEVALREGPGYDQKIVSVLNSGDVVEIAEKGEKWSRVRIADGPSGWILTRLLTEREPNAAKIHRLEQQLAGLPAGEGADKSALQTENLKLQDALAEVRFELQAARQANADLESLSPDDARRHRSLDEARNRIKVLEARLADCRDRLSDNILADRVRWFLAGAAVLLIGLLLGLKIQRRHRSGLL